jgi:hypothetical protein
VAALFGDSAFGAPIVERLRTLGFDNVHEASFGVPITTTPTGVRICGVRLPKGAILDEEQPALQICLPGFHINRSKKLVLESKSDLAQRGESSPDDADALALTFAQPVMPIEAPQQEPVLYDIFVDGFSGLGGGWMR